MDVRDEGAGKTTTALLMASRGAQLLANDRVFIKRVGADLRVLPWPSAGALPHHQVVLGHDVGANADFLAELSDSL